MTSKEESDNKDETAPTPAGADGAPVQPSTKLAVSKPDKVAAAPAISRTATAPVAGRATIAALKPPPVTSKSESSLPVSMLVRPEGDGDLPSGAPSRRFDGELPESFETVLARVEPLSSSPRLSGLWRRFFSPAFSRQPSQTRRVVAFDGFRSDLYDDKLERDRRYGTVYTVVEQQQRLPRAAGDAASLASSALRATWNLPA